MFFAIFEFFLKIYQNMDQKLGSNKMHSSYAYIQMKYKSSLELGLQTFVILDIHPNKNPTIELEFFFISCCLGSLNAKQPFCILE